MDFKLTENYCLTMIDQTKKDISSWPWKVRYDEHGRITAVESGRPKEGGKVRSICQFNWLCQKHFKQRQRAANARLMACSPRLFNELLEVALLVRQMDMATPKQTLQLAGDLQRRLPQIELALFNVASDGETSAKDKYQDD